VERAKIIERTTRGRLHRLRMGELSSNGHRIYGYDYVRKTATAPAALVTNEEQAPVVRSIFESRRYQKVVRPSGRLSVYHRAVYRCNRRARENMHDRTRIERCRNSEIGTHILEGKVFELIREIMLDPAKLRGCIDTGGRLDDQSIARELARVAGEVRALDQERRRLIDRYAAEQMAGEVEPRPRQGP
jgi:hypothetical protein